MPAVDVRYWAGAARAAGTKQEHLTVATVAELRATLAGRPALAAVSGVASVLVDGRQWSEDDPLPDGAQVDVLPPFAGGAR